MKRGAIAIGVAIATAATLGSAAPRTGRPVPRPAGGATPAVPAPIANGTPTDLRARFGVERATILAHEGDADERLRGIVRAAAIGTSDAIALVALGAGDEDARVRIAVARGLGAHMDQVRARDALFLIVTSDPPRLRANERDDEDRLARIDLARRIAATALARSHDTKSVEKLAALARADAAGSRIAGDALVAFPPIGSTGAWARPMTANALELAARTGDLRALEPALEAARSGDRTMRVAAIETLGALGDARVLDLARKALGDTEPRMRSAGASALVALGASDAAAAVEQLLGDDATIARGVALAADVHSTGVARALAARVASGSDTSIRAAAIAALGRDPSADAIEALVTFVADPIVRAEALDALARSPSPDAMHAIETLTVRIGGDARARRLAVRAYVVRAAARGETSESLDRATGALAASEDGRDRAVGLFAQIVLGKAELGAALADRDARVRRAAALASLARPSDAVREALLTRDAVEKDPLTRIALASALAGGDPRGHVPTRALLHCARAGGADAPVCTVAFARRADPSEAGAVDALLASLDPVIRAHAARGLASSEDPTRSGRLAEAYAYEPSPLVRRAIVLALATAGAGGAPAVRNALDAAARFDPDAETRSIAERVLANRPLVARDAGPTDVAWLHLVDATGDAPGTGAPGATGATGATGSLIRADGLAVPIVFDDDGDALVPGVPAGEARLVLAPRVGAAYSESP